jgi:hypothetical protein
MSKGFLESLVEKVGSVVNAGAAGVDTIIETVVEKVGLVLSPSERAEVEEAASDVVAGMKVDDAAAAATVVPAAPAPAVPVVAPPAPSAPAAS